MQNMRKWIALFLIMLLPVLVQLNAECLRPFWRRKRYLDMLRTGRAHLLGSDCHNVSSRAPDLAEGRRIIEKQLGKEALVHIDQLGAQLLSGAAVEETVQS